MNDVWFKNEPERGVWMAIHKKSSFFRSNYVFKTRKIIKQLLCSKATLSMISIAISFQCTDLDVMSLAYLIVFTVSWGRTDVLKLIFKHPIMKLFDDYHNIRWKYTNDEDSLPSVDENKLIIKLNKIDIDSPESVKTFLVLARHSK